jgi:hypothetical protein
MLIRKMFESRLSEMPFPGLLGRDFTEFWWSENDIRDLKQTGRERDDDGYSHNDIPDFVQKKWIIKSPMHGS